MDPLLSSGEFVSITGREGIDYLVLAAASGIVRAYCGWEITSVVDQTVVLDSNGSQLLMVPSLQLTDVSAVVVKGVDWYGLPLLQPASWTWSTAGMVQCTWPRWGGFGMYGTHGFDGRPATANAVPPGLGRVAVTYSGGYQDVPPELQAVTCSVAERITAPSEVAQRLENVGGIQTSETYSRATDGNGLTAMEVAVLARYRLPVMR